MSLALVLWLPTSMSIGLIFSKWQVFLGEILGMLALTSVALYFAFAHRRYTPLADYVDRRLFELFWAAVIIRCACFADTSIMVKILDIWPLRSLGRISYGVYLVHNVVPLISRGTVFDNQRAHTLLGLCVFVATAITIPTISWFLVEKLILRFKASADNLADYLTQWKARSFSGRGASKKGGSGQKMAFSRMQTWAISTLDVQAYPIVITNTYCY